MAKIYPFIAFSLTPGRAAKICVCRRERGIHATTIQGSGSRAGGDLPHHSERQAHDIRARLIRI